MSGVYAEDHVQDELKCADCIIFDCDGVLIDIRESYDRTISETAAMMLERIGIPHDILISHEMIEGFKRTGGFNDEVDLTYAVIVSAAAAHRLNMNPYDMIRDVQDAADQTGIASVDRFLDGISDVSDVRRMLSHPGEEKSPLYVAFDRVFYGERYEEMFGMPSDVDGPGLIDRDIVIVTEGLLDVLGARFDGRMGMVTGRGRRSAGYSLKGMMGRFDVSSSFFLEDHPRHMAKPNPASLERCIAGMGGRHAVYVGDSMEDLMMARSVSVPGVKVTFCGITGTSGNPERRLELFRRNGAGLVCESIHDIPRVLNL